MSTRPNLFAFIGITDAVVSDPRCDYGKFEEALDIGNPVPPFGEHRECPRPGDDRPDGGVYAEDIVFHGNPSGSGLKNLIGVQVSQEASEDLARFFMSTFGINGDGYKILPLSAMSDWMANQYATRGEPYHMNKYEYYTPWSREHYEEKVLHTLHYVGWHGVTREMLKWALVWYWA